jgi:F0F1-type ATP synthase assembly protein I
MNEDPRRQAPHPSSLAFTFVGLVLVFTGIGYLVDRWLETGPWVMVAGVFVGAGLGFMYMVFILFTTGNGGRGSKDDSDQGPGRL